MVSQLFFTLPEIDREQTKSLVEKALEKYRIYLLSVPEDKMPKMTATYSLVPPSFSNEFHSQTEQIAIGNIDYEVAKEKHIEWVTRAINRLRYKERELIIKRYLEDEVYDYELYNQMGMSERKYYRLKARAFYNLAFALKVEKYVEKDVVGS